MNKFKLHAPYQPTGDQPQAIEALVKGFKEGNQFQTLLGVTGSGKTFTMANVIQALNKPTLVLAHNKTLAAQLYGEFKEFFPENAVEYFVSYYDYYQPEYVDLRCDGAGAHSLWVASCVLLTFLADGRGRYDGSRRTPGGRGSEYFLCPVGRSDSGTVRRIGDPVYVR